MGLSYVSLDRDRLDPVAHLDSVSNVLPGRDLPKVRVQLVEMPALTGAEKELTVVRNVDVVPSGHSDRALHERQVAQFCAFGAAALSDLIGVRVVRARERIAALRNEVRKYGMETESIVETSFGFQREDRDG